MTMLTNETLPDAVGAQVGRGVGRLSNEGTDAEGPRGTYGCACKSRDAAECHRLRYGIVAGDVSHGAEECYCLCHSQEEHDTPTGALMIPADSLAGVLLREFDTPHQAMMYATRQVHVWGQFNDTASAAEYAAAAEQIRAITCPSCGLVRGCYACQRICTP